MAQLDVSEVLLDPDFFDPITLIHRKTFVNEYGENELTETCLPTIGTIQPATGKVLARLPDALRNADISSFWIRGQIISDGSCKYPDLIVFRGQKYAIQQVFDWMNYGQGYCEGVAVREKPTV